jgi:hypothetical protein
MTNLVTVDSLVANEFGLEINGQRVGGIFRIAHLVTFSLDDSGKRVKPPFEISKMVERDGNNVFNTWLRETLGGSQPRREVTVLAIDDGVITRRWKVKNAWIKEVKYSAFDSASFEMVAETAVILYDDIEDSFPATPA